MTSRTRQTINNMRKESKLEIDRHIYTYSTNLSPAESAADVLEATRTLFGTLGIALEDFEELRLINDLAVWELYIVVNPVLAVNMPNATYAT